MRQLMLALAIGLSCGLLATWYVLRPAEGAVSSANSTGSKSGQPNDDSFDSAPDRAERVASGITVHVVRNGRKLEGATVSIFQRTPVDWVPLVRGRTDTDGNLNFPAGPGRFAMRVSAEDGAVTMHLVDIPWSKEPETVELGFGAPEQHKGSVIEAHTKTPIAGAVVIWSPTDEGLTLPREFAIASKSDAFGRFAFGVPPKLTANLEATAERYVRTDDQTFNFAKPGTEVVLELTRAALAAGVVVDEAGHPVANAIVTTRPEEDVAHTTAADGTFELKVRPGGATLHALAPTGPQALTRVILEAGERRGDLRLVVGPGSRLEGLVTDQAQRPMAETEVRVLAEPDELEVARVTTTPQGLFTAFAIPAGRYSLAAETKQHWLGRSVGIEHPTTEPIAVRVLASASLEGTVLNASRAPVANASIELHYPTLSKFAPVHARTDENGHYQANDLVSGELSVRASLGDIADESRTVYLQPGDTGRLDFTLGLAGRIKGHVNGPLHRWSLFFINKDRAAQGKNEQTDDHGDFDVPMSAGTYDVLVADMHIGRHQTTTVTVQAGETVTIELVGRGEELDGGEALVAAMREGPLGGGISFDNGPGGVQVGFLNNDSRMAKSGVHTGDLVIAIDGTPVRDSLDAFARVKTDGPELSLTLRREGVDRVVVVK